MDDLEQRLKQLIAGLFKCDLSQVTDEIGPGDLPAWDSLGHVALMARIQEQFEKHVPVEDAIEVESVRDLVTILRRLEDETA